MHDALGQYAKLIRTAEQQPFGNLQRELAAYWHVLQPVMRWDANERRVHGYVFLRDEVYPRRTAMLG